MPELFVTNYNRRYTGVSSTAQRMAVRHLGRYDLALVGHPLPGVPEPIAPREARRLSKRPPKGRPFAIWHVRRDPEMISALYARDVLRLPIRTVFTSAAKHRHSGFPRWLISRMDAVIATSEEAASFFPAVAATLPHGVDVDGVTPATDRRAAWDRLGFGGTHGVAIVGRVRRSKGTDIFVDAMIRVMADDPGVHALIVGLAKQTESEFVKRMEAKIAAAGLTERFHFLGDTQNERLRHEIMPAISLVVNVARYEPFGVVPIEGMAAGTPFVCSDTGHYRAFSDRGRTGLIVPTEDVAATAAAVSSLLSDPERLGAMGRAAREKAVADHSIRAEADGAAEVYERLWAGEPLAVHRPPL